MKKTSRTVAVAVLASLLLAGFPRTARADEAPGGIRASIDRAVAQLDRQPAAAKTRDHRPVAKAAQAAYGGGGGGGKGMMIVSLVTTVVGLAATYYLVKQMQEQSKQQTGQQ
jgi:uncharacterized protein HemX